MTPQQDHSGLATGYRFRCFVEGTDIKARVLRVSSDGAIFTTQADLKKGSLVLAYPYSDESGAVAVVLIGSVVALLGITGPAYSMQWLRCVGQHGLGPVMEILCQGLKLDREVLTVSASKVMFSPVVGYEFPSSRFYIPQAKKRAKRETPSPAPSASETSGPSLGSGQISTSYSTGPGRKEATGVIGAADEVRAATDRPQPSRTPSSTATEAVRVTEAVRTPTPAPSAQPAPQPAAPTPPAQPAAPTPPAQSAAPSPPAAQPRPQTASSPQLPGMGEVTQRLLGQERARIPVNLSVEYAVNGKKSPGTIKALGSSTLFLATDPSLEPDEGEMGVILPIPNQREATFVNLECRVESVEKGDILGYPGVDLVIVRTHQGNRPGIFERYIKTLYYKMTRERSLR